MRFSTTILLLSTTLSTITTATPVPRSAAYSDIEKRWASGTRDERELHSGLTHRDMTPAWPMHARDGEGADFASATWMRAGAGAGAGAEASKRRRRRSAGLLSRMRDFAERFLGSASEEEEKRKRGDEQAGEVLVLRPRKVRYYFTRE